MRNPHRALWKKGAGSPNPGGRPKAVVAVEETARLHTVDAMNTLAEICKDTNQPGSARVAAANALLDRGWGRAKQSVEISGTVDARRLNDVALDEAFRAELADFLAGNDSGNSVTQIEGFAE